MNHGHATKKGCDQMGQNTSYYCACHSMQEVIRNLYGIVIPQKKIAGIMGTTSKGTGHQGFHTFVAWFNKEYKKKLAIKEMYFSDLTEKQIITILKSKNQDIVFHLLYLMEYGHYEVANSLANKVWNIQNSLGSKCATGCYCGHRQERSMATMRKWINGKKGVKSCLIFTKK